MAVMEGHREIKLRRKAFDTLLVLLRKHDQVLSKDELVAAVWPDVVVNDDALAQCVRDVRKALGDTSERYIRTLSRRGYRQTLRVKLTNSYCAITPRPGPGS